MVETTARMCIFCGRPAGSSEHMFPNWLNRVFPPEQIGPAEAHFGSSTVEGENHRMWLSGRVASQTVKELCHSCNTGWMAALESEAKPLLVPMVTGHPTRLDQVEQLVVAAWAVKTAMVGERAVEPVMAFTSEDRALVMSQRRPPAHVMVCAASVVTENGPLRFVCARGAVMDGDTQVANVHYYTLQVGTLVLQVTRPEPPFANSSLLSGLPIAGQVEIPIFPPVTEFYWPPAKDLDEEHFGSYTAREGWMPVTGGVPRAKLPEPSWLWEATPPIPLVDGDGPEV